MPDEPTMKPPKSGVKIRLYRKFLGDCILLAFPTSDEEKAFYVLIDCGAFAAAPLKKAAEDIKKATGGIVDVVVMTHEHKDHISGFGFNAPETVFRTMTFKKLWMAWTEGQSDLAKRLQRESGRGLAALASSVKSLRQLGISELADEVEELLDTSFGVDAPQVDEYRKNLLGMIPDPHKNHLTWEPGDWCEPLGESGPRFCFLGPPMSESLLKKDEVAGEHYEDHGFAVESSFHSGIAAMVDSGTQTRDEFRPFGSEAGIGVPDAKQDKFFATRYFGSTTDVLERDEITAAPEWRRIDSDWLNQIRDLALQYDGCINNTSLVMAVDFPGSRKVVLLVADAQAGNWLSWSDESNGAVPTFNVRGEKFTSIDLLRRSVFYKVGHHGSHNGTLKKGLEQLGRDLPEEGTVAMIPTDETYAWTKKPAWRMPELALYKRLLEITEGRVVQGDCGLPDKKEKNVTPNPKTSDAAYSDTLWDEVQELVGSYQGNIDKLRANDAIYTENELYIEYTVLDE